MNPDVLIVGAGPAGVVASVVLARAGARVRLIDRATFPRDKLCGDTLNAGTLGLLTRLRLSQGIERRAIDIRGKLRAHSSQQPGQHGRAAAGVYWRAVCVGVVIDWSRSV